MKFSKFATNHDLEIEGAWVDIGEGAKLLIARIGNDRYAKYLDKAYKPYRKMQRTNSIPEDLARKIFIAALANTVLVGWEGFVDDNGVEIPYTVENAIAKLTEFKDFRELVAEIGSEASTFRDEEIAEEVELLTKKSSGTSTGAVGSKS